MADPPSEFERLLHAALGDRFTLQGELARGGMAVVYSAWDERHHRRVAVKVLHTRTDARGAQRFLEEIRTTAGLTHPNLVPLIDSGHAGRRLYYIMPLLDGESLDIRLRRDGRLQVRDALRIAGDVAAGLAYAHRHGVIHRDVKPGNILLAPDGRATLSDFGIAHAVHRASADPLTRSGFVTGTPAYLSPEQAAGQPIDARADVYALGLVIHEMLSGTTPVSGLPAGPLNSFRPDVSRELSLVVSRATAPDPDDRFRTAEEVAEELERVGRESGPRRRSAAARSSPRTLEDGLGDQQKAGTSGKTTSRRRAGLLLTTALVTAVGLLLSFIVIRGGTDGPSGTADGRATVAAEVPPDVRVGVLPVESGSDASSTSERGRLIQHYLATELSRHRGIAVVDPLSLNSRLAGEAPEGAGDLLEELRRWEVGFAVRTTLVGGPDGAQVSYVLIDTRNGEVVESGGFDAGADLPARVRRMSARLLQILDRETGGLTRTLDIEPWLNHAPTKPAAVDAFLRGTDYSYRGMAGGGGHFERAVTLDPTFIAPRVWLVSGYTASGDTAEALKHLEALQDLESKATPFEQAAIRWAEATVSGDQAARVRHLRVALGYSPRNNILLYELGETLYEMGRIDEALEPVRLAAESRWPFSPLYPLLGAIAVRLGQPEGLRGELEAARELVGPTPGLDGLLEALALFEGDEEAALRYRESLRSQMAAGTDGERLVEFPTIYRALARRALSKGDSVTAAVLQERTPPW